MPSLPPIPQVPREVLIVIGAVVVLVVLWLGARYGRRRYIVVGKSSASDELLYELSRIASALERLATLATPRETQPPADEEKAPRRVNWFSMFNR